jgi:S1-C subfamily serine protease
MALAKVFINYRREDSAGHAGRIYDRMKERLPGQVFIDVTGIEPGLDFVEAIDKEVSSCDVCIVVIGPRWLTSEDHTGVRRLENGNDFVRLEVATALKRNVRVIPVLVAGARMPRPEELPEDLKLLARRNAIDIDDTDFDNDVRRLAETVERVLAAASPGPAGPQVRAEKAQQPATSKLPLWKLLVPAGLVVVLGGLWLLSNGDGGTPTEVPVTATPGEPVRRPTGVRKPVPDKQPAAGGETESPDTDRAALSKIADSKRGAVAVLQFADGRTLATGFMAGTTGLILTADYVEKAGQVLRASITGAVFPLSLARVTRELGLAVYQPRRATTDLPQLSFAREPPAANEPVVAIGATPSGSLDVAFGRVSGHDDKKFVQILFDRSEMAGFGGAPVLNRSGQVVGVHHSGARDRDGASRQRGLCVRSDLALRFVAAVRKQLSAQGNARQPR